MRCALTGATGLLGRRCARALERAQHSVQRWTRCPERPGDVAFELGSRVDPELLRGVDAVIHCAHDFSARALTEDRRINVDGALRLLEASERAGVKRWLFVSSVAAFEGCSSSYGTGKLLVERAVLPAGGRVLRPGLLWGAPPAGAYRTLCRLAALPVVPLPEGGRQPIAIAHVDDVAYALVRALERFDDVPGAPVVLAHPRRPTVAEFLRAVARRVHGRTLRTVSFPSWAALAPLEALERSGVLRGFSADPLRTLLAPDPMEAPPPPAALGVTFRAYESAERPDDR